MKPDIDALNQQLEGKSAEEVLQYFMKDYEGKVSLSSSMGAEDQVLTHMMMHIDADANIFTLDTGRVFPETYDTIAATNQRYNTHIKVFFPLADKVEEMVNSKGINLFYESIGNRKLCCHIRKIEPLQRALKDVDVWVTGLRKDQSVTRFFTKMVEWDDVYQCIKINPLLNWREKDVWAFIKENDVPYNKLHDMGYPSIGCQPCTRAIQKGEDVRAGRWWWEQPEHKECGLHVKE